MNSIKKIHNNNNNKFGFTLVELIVTMTILAILGTISFVYFNSHIKNSRDSVRITDIKNIEKSLGIYISERGSYPQPDEGIDVTYSGGLAWTQGIIGENLLRSLKVSKVIDPLTSNPYTYSITGLKNAYEIGAIREGNIAQSFNFIGTTYAADKTALALVRGTYNGKAIRVSTGGLEYIIATPSIITSDLSVTDLGLIIDNKILVFNNRGNLPESYKNLGYVMTGGFDFVPKNNIVLFTGTLSNAGTNHKRLLILDGIKRVYSESLIESNYSDVAKFDISANQKQALMLTDSLRNIIGEHEEKGSTGSYYYQLSAGYRHTCGIKVGGKLYCWGLNGNGQLGDNSTQQRNGPTQVYNGTDYKQVSAGYYYTCGIKTNGKLFCWGYNTNGQLGRGNVSQSNIPVEIMSGTIFNQISLGNAHTCGITTENKLYCWGLNTSGQVGDGTQIQKTSPVAIDSGNSYKYVSTGVSHTCGIRLDGKLYCWGLNTSGQLGRGNTTSPATSPVSIDLTNDYSSVFLGNAHTCGIRTDGKLYCWGYNTSGQLGRGNTTSPATSPVHIASGTTFKTITQSVGNYTCGIKSDNKLFCWGLNINYQLGDGTQIQKTSPVPIDSNFEYDVISAGESHTCGMKSDGKLFCWGYNGNGQLGYGVEIESNTPEEVGGGSLYRDIDAKGDHTCAVGLDNKAYCWGLNANGQVGDGTQINKLNVTKIDLSNDYSYLSVGGTYTCGIKTDGKLYCWGANGNGQLGRGNTSQSLIPIHIASGSTYTKVTSSFYRHTCGIQIDGKLYCWGINSNGQLGDGSIIQRNSPVVIDSTNTYIDISTGYSHTCGIRLDGKLYCWGVNTYGQLGDGTIIQKTSPVAIDSTNTYKSVSLGYYHTCAIRSDDNLYCWGRNNNRQLGDGTSTSYKSLPTFVSSGSSYKSISLGSYHTCGTKTDDTLSCWGLNTYGQLGDGTKIQKSIPTLIDSGNVYMKVTTGVNHTCGIKFDGRIYCWGYNNAGQLGINAANPSIPNEIY